MDLLRGVTAIAGARTGMPSSAGGISAATPMIKMILSVQDRLGRTSKLKSIINLKRLNPRIYLPI